MASRSHPLAAYSCVRPASGGTLCARLRVSSCHDELVSAALAQSGVCTRPSPATPTGKPQTGRTGLYRRDQRVSNYYSRSGVRGYCRFERRGQGGDIARAVGSKLGPPSGRQDDTSG